MEIFVVLCTFPNGEVARQIATALVEAQVVACVNLCPRVESIYRWEGKVESSGEVLAFMKTTSGAWPQLEARLRELHPYDVPEILALPAERVSPAYAAWVEGSVRGAAESP